MGSRGSRGGSVDLFAHFLLHSTPVCRRTTQHSHWTSEYNEYSSQMDSFIPRRRWCSSYSTISRGELGYSTRPSNRPSNVNYPWSSSHTANRFGTSNSLILTEGLCTTHPGVLLPGLLPAPPLLSWVQYPRPRKSYNWTLKHNHFLCSHSRACSSATSNSPSIMKSSSRSFVTLSL